MSAKLTKPVKVNHQNSFVFVILGWKHPNP